MLGSRNLSCLFWVRRKQVPWRRGTRKGSGSGYDPSASTGGGGVGERVGETQLKGACSL